MLAAVFASFGALLLVSLSTGAPPNVEANSTLYLKIQAPLAEVEPSDLVSQFVSQPPSLRSTIEQIKKAKVDSRVKAVVIRVETAGGLWAQVQDIRRALEDYKSSGKPLVAFLEAGGAQDYYVASVADRIVLMPAGQLDLSGLASYELFFRGALDKIGVYPDLLHIGDYKTASNTFVEKGFTPAHREMTQSMNKDWYDELVRAVAAGRKLDDAKARAAVNGGPYLGEAAKQAGLVDDLAYEDQLDDKAPIQGTRPLEMETYAKVPVNLGPREPGARIALLYATGTIASGKSSEGSGSVLGSDTFNKWLRKVRVDTSVRAVVVRIDSPGGSAIASEVMWRELMLTRDVKPLIVSMGDVAASGGYYIAAPAHVIVAEPGTITGSIGVVTGKFVLQGTMDKIGVGTATVKDGPNADINSPFRPFTSEERAKIEEQMQTTYELFLSRVAQGRNQPASKIDAIAQGRVWTGQQAHQIGLVDEIGGLDDALRIAKQRAKLDPKKDVDLLIYPPRRTFYDVLANPLGTADESAQAFAARQTTLRAPALPFSRPEIKAVETALATLSLFRRGEPLAVMPNVFVR